MDAPAHPTGAAHNRVSKAPASPTAALLDPGCTRFPEYCGGALCRPSIYCRAGWVWTARWEEGAPYCSQPGDRRPNEPGIRRALVFPNDTSYNPHSYSLLFLALNVTFSSDYNLALPQGLYIRRRFPPLTVLSLTSTCASSSTGLSHPLVVLYYYFYCYS